MRMRRVLTFAYRFACACAISPTSARGDREREREKMKETGSTSLRAELQVLLEDPTNFYNVVMRNTGERGEAAARTQILMGGARSISHFSLSTSVLLKTLV